MTYTACFAFNFGELSGHPSFFCSLWSEHTDMNKWKQGVNVEFCPVINLFTLFFPVADWLCHRHPSHLLHEETPVVCAEEQEDRLQASEVNGNKRTTIREGCLQ